MASFPGDFIKQAATNSNTRLACTSAVCGRSYKSFVQMYLLKKVLEKSCYKKIRYKGVTQPELKGDYMPATKKSAKVEFTPVNIPGAA